MPVDTLSLSVSSPTQSGGRKTIGLIPGLVLPIELANDCSEEGVTIESDDVLLTNMIRCHFLKHFGHRDLEGIISDYTSDAILIQVVNGQERTKYHGHAEIRSYFADIFEEHPTGASSFHLEHVGVDKRHGMAVWTAKTPTLTIEQGSDTLVFNTEGKIIKEFFSCQSHPRVDPGTSKMVRKSSSECGEFFQ
jgi:ketosteroid isomerase-like protein